ATIDEPQKLFSHRAHDRLASRIECRTPIARRASGADAAYLDREVGTVRVNLGVCILLVILAGGVTQAGRIAQRVRGQITRQFPRTRGAVVEELLEALHAIDLFGS